MQLAKISSLLNPGHNDFSAVKPKNSRASSDFSYFQLVMDSINKPL